MGILITGCNGLTGSSLPTPMPTEYLPTAVALTLEAGKTLYPPLVADLPTEMPKDTSVIPTDMPEDTQVIPTETPTVTVQEFATPTSLPVLSTPTETPMTIPDVVMDQITIPDAEMEIRAPGHLSKVASPLSIYAIVKPGYLNRVRVDLIGEDQRVLARQIVTLQYINRYGEAVLSMKLGFEIPGAAEAARLAISVEDQFGRMTKLNSIPLILISIGDSDVIPALDMRQPIMIQQPAPKTLIQGDTVVVSGLAHPDGDEYIMIQLVDESGKIVGKRVCSLSEPGDSGYGSFVIDVPYSVTESTPALLTVWQSDGGFSNIIHLVSQEILLSP